MVIYTVQPGDSVYAIARKYQVPVQRLMDDNALEDLPHLIPGQAIVVMTQTVQHRVGKGETLYSLARKYHMTIDAILNANQSITDPDLITQGQTIIIPASSQKLGEIEVNGYVFPNIDEETLRRTLPHLTYISIFSYQALPDGSLIEIDDQSVINAARVQKVSPLMVVTNIKEGGGFDSDLARSILDSEAVQDQFIKNILETLPKGYTGVDIDFEYVYPEDREKYNRFLTKVTETLHPLGYTVSTALAPKTESGQIGLLYQAHDYAFHGATVDHIILMTYEWGYTRGPAQAVAPLNRVEQVIRYAVTAIPSEKILMGIPNYGYDWTLPFVPGSAARSISNLEAVALAAKYGSRVRFDDTAQSPHFYYFSLDGRRHVVWFEDARSIAAKLRLVDEYHLGGVSYWTLNKFFPQNWLVLEAMYDVKKLL